MAFEGRIEGRVSQDGMYYELVQRGEVRQRYHIAEAQADPKLRAAIKRNGWRALP